MKEEIMNLTSGLDNEQLKEIIKQAIKEAIPAKEIQATMTIEQCVEFSGIGRDKITELAHGNNDFPAFKNGSKTLINREMLVLWLERVSKEKRVI